MSYFAFGSGDLTDSNSGALKIFTQSAEAGRPLEIELLIGESQ